MQSVPEHDNALSPHVNVARDVLTTEADALHVLANNLPADLPRAVDAILAQPGRVIVSGIGKSGHIGKKIAATFASTGTPAYFIHATEASHGDLGMIGAGDLVILISNSGETAELGDLIAHTRRFRIPLVAISSRPNSSLMAAADFKLSLPAAEEACGLGMVPTTSTTMTLALGDALAVALLQARGFQSENFAINHPGGRLGAQMATVGQLMHADDKVPRVAGDLPMRDALIAMSAGGFGIAAVCEGDKLLGVISDGDLRRNIDRLMDATAADIMNASPITAPPEQLAAEALAVMNDKKIGVLIVTNGTQAVGVLHVHDLLRAGVA